MINLDTLSGVLIRSLFPASTARWCDATTAVVTWVMDIAPASTVGIRVNFVRFVAFFWMDCVKESALIISVLHFLVAAGRRPATAQHCDGDRLLRGLSVGSLPASERQCCSAARQK